MNNVGHVDHNKQMINNQLILCALHLYETIIDWMTLTFLCGILGLLMDSHIDQQINMNLQTN